MKLAYGESINNKVLRTKEISWENFTKLFQDYEISTEKSGRYIIAATINDTLRRRKANCTGVNFLAIDVDIHCNDFIERLEVIKDFNYVYHTTFSHSENDHRFHLFIQCLGVDIFNYRKAIHFITKLTGIPVSNESTVVCQPFFLPRVHPERVFDFKYEVNEGDFFIYTGDEIPALEIPQDAPFRELPEPEIDIDITEIISHLQNLDPECDMDNWLKVGMALHHQFKGAQQGFRLWDVWSSGELHDKKVSKYADGKRIGTHKTWKTFNSNLPGCTTFKSVIRMSKEVCSHGLVKAPKHAFSNLCYLKDCDSFYDANDDSIVPVKSLNNMYKHLVDKGLVSNHLLKRSDFPRCYDVVKIPFSPAGKCYLKGEQFQFEVDKGLNFVEIDGKSYVNTYKPKFSQISPLLGQIQHVEKVFYGHLDMLLNDYKLQMLFLSFLAYPIQRPPLRSRWAVIMQGNEGIAKSFFGECIRAVLGPDNVRIADYESVMLHNYNDSWASGYQFVVIEEIDTEQGRRRLLFDKMKTYISNDVIDVNQKFRSTRSVMNIANYLMFTNHYHALMKVPKNSRRFLCLACNFFSKEYVEELTDMGYYRNLHRLHRDYAEVLYQFFLDAPLASDFDPDGVAPKGNVDCQISLEFEVIEHVVQGLTVIPIAELHQKVNDELRTLYDDYQFVIKPQVINQALYALGFYRKRLPDGYAFCK